MTIARDAKTRSELSRLRRRLQRVERGIDLLERKREALVRELFRTARPAVQVREQIEQRSARAWHQLLDALPSAGHAQLRSCGWPSRQIDLVLEERSLWGMAVAELVERPALRRGAAARGIAPAVVGPSAIRAAEEFEDLAELLLDGLSQELRLRRLSRALERTRRQVNTLEQRVRPRLQDRQRLIRMALEEREREEHLRLRHLRGQRFHGGGPRAGRGRRGRVQEPDSA